MRTRRALFLQSSVFGLLQHLAPDTGFQEAIWCCYGCTCRATCGFSRLHNIFFAVPLTGMGWTNVWKCWSDKPRQAAIHEKLGRCKDVVLNSCFWKARPKCKFKRDMLLPWRRRHSQVARLCPDLQCIKFIFNAPPRGIWKKKLSSAEVTVILGVLRYPCFFKLFVACNPETRSILNINLTHSKHKKLDYSGVCSMNSAS